MSSINIYVLCRNNSMNAYLKYGIVILAIMLLDVMWIGINIKMYSDSVKLVQKSEMTLRYHYVAMAYALVAFAALYVTIPFAMSKIDMKQDDIATKLYKSFAYGGGVGFCIYGIYNLTCLSIYQDYEARVAIADTIWGTFLNTLAVLIYTLLP